MTDHRALDRRRHPDVAELRTESTDNTNIQHFCSVCACSKSGWADVPNRVAEWCENLRCRCHEEDETRDG